MWIQWDSTTDPIEAWPTFDFLFRHDVASEGVGGWAVLLHTILSPNFVTTVHPLEWHCGAIQNVPHNVSYNLAKFVTHL